MRQIRARPKQFYAIYACSRVRVRDATLHSFLSLYRGPSAVASPKNAVELLVERDSQHLMWLHFVLKSCVDGSHDGSQSEPASRTPVVYFSHLKQTTGFLGQGRLHCFFLGFAGFSPLKT